MNNLKAFDLEKTTTEILILKDQTAQNIIEIGKRLVEVKENLEHGEFLNWLENRVDFGVRTAQNFMKVATVFPNTQPVSHLGTRKLLALAGLDEEERHEVMQEKNIETMTTRELEQAVKEKKEIKKQLEAEQEYSEELQEAIKQKDNQINDLKSKLEQTKIPKKEIVEKEVIKEVVPESIQSQVEQLEKEKKELFEKLEEAKSTIVTLNNQKNNEKYGKYYDYRFDELSSEMANFLRNASKYTYMEKEYSELSTSKKTLLKNGIKKVEAWVLNMKKAMNETLMIGNDIYIEGEDENE